MWRGVDFDGTLAYSEPGVDHDGSLGEPIPEMIKFVKELLALGIEVRILTARVWCPQGGDWNAERARKVAQQRIMIMDWCETHLGKRLKVTCEKDPYMERLYDDRAVQVVRNKGILVG